MKTQDFLVSYIIVHIIPAYDWIMLSYPVKQRYHYIVTVGGRQTPMCPLQHTDGCIEIAYAGSEPYAASSIVLFSLLIELWQQHPGAKIVYAHELYNRTNTAPIVSAAHWLRHHMPQWLQSRLSRCSSLITLHSLLPSIH